MSSDHAHVPEFDVRQIPFSRRGSWLDISPVIGLHRTAEHLHLVSHQTGMHAVMRFRPDDPASIRATASSLTWTTASGTIDAVFASVSTLRLRGRGAALTLEDATSELTPFTGTFLFQDPIDGSAVFTSYETGRRYRITALDGELEVVGGELLGTGERRVRLVGDTWEAVVEEYEAGGVPTPHLDTFDDLVEAVGREFAEYVDRIAGWRDDTTPAAALAAYVMWSATVAPRGFVPREAVLMSKHWMDKVWSWDHCFNAIALAAGLPDAALDNFLVPFDLQDATGAMPDSITHSEVLYNFVKPPIHGWALTMLRERLDVDLSTEQLGEIHDRLAAWSRFWLDRRRVPGHALPHYQHGNDSGWDNATTFDLDRVIEAPDLAAFLGVQLEVLADLADELGKPGAERWREHAAALFDALDAELWRGDHYVARAAATGRESTSSSLLTLLPILAAEHLPESRVAHLVRRIERHLTAHGLATEPVDSPHYESDGYWRGPIWAPSTMLVHDGLRRAGRSDLADAVSARFRTLCESSGFAENFDAVTGEGLRDRAYTWTASVYLILAAQAVRHRTNNAGQQEAVTTAS